jgi:hypothetical protein
MAMRKAKLRHLCLSCDGDSGAPDSHWRPWGACRVTHIRHDLVGAWAVRSTEYFEEKVSAGVTRESCPDVAREAAEQIIEDYSLSADDAATVLDAVQDWRGVDVFHEACRDVGVHDCWEYNTENWTRRFLWLREAVRWFVVRVDWIHHASDEI